MNVKELILEKDIELFFNAMLINDKTTAEIIVDRQENADLLLYGFKEKRRVKKQKDLSTSFAECKTQEELIFKINLLEVLSSSEKFFDFVEIAIKNYNIKEDLLSREPTETEKSLKDVLNQKDNVSDFFRIILNIKKKNKNLK